MGRLHQRFLQALVIGFMVSSCISVVPVEDIPIGAASLAFVFDITGSMYDDLVQVTEGAATILATALARTEKPLYNYVLVPFHDPDIGPHLVTSDPEEFQRELRTLYVQGGGDCPEMSIGAIQLALEQSLPNSFIYVFTDARSKDYYLTNEVLTLIQQKQSQVVFVLTGDCGNNTHKGYKAYEEIASTSSGQVFLLKKSQVNQVLNFVKVAVQARKVNLMSVDTDTGRTQRFPIPIDSKLQEITVSVSGETPSIILRNPYGEELPLSNFDYTEDTPNYLNELLNIKNVLIHNLKNPDPGIWELEVKSGGPHTIRVTGLSTVDFAAGFAKKPGTDFAQTSMRPVEGILSHVVINASDLNPPAKLTRLELVDLKGEALIEFPVTRDPDNPALYNVTSFIPPNEFFYLKVDGLDHDGYVLRRTTPTAISPRVPTGPTVTIPDLTRGFFDQTAVLTCFVDSLIPYTVRWFRRGVQQGYDVHFYDSANATLEIPRAGSNSEGDYVCNATNLAGSATGMTYLDISDPPPVISKTWNISVLPGDDAILTCNAFSTVEFNMTWYKPGRYGPVALDPRVRVLSNGSLLIRNVQREDVGRYMCKASNEGGSTEDKVFLRLQEPPIARTIPRSQNFLIGQTINITCEADGYPQPTYNWMRGGKFIVPSKRIFFEEGTLIIRKIRRTDEGDYDCLAKNPAGEDVSMARVNYIESPRIRQYEKRLLVATGDKARLTCEAEGIPTPDITWYRGDRKLQSAYNVGITLNGRLIIRNVQEMDAGEYRCVAKNEAGSDSAKVRLEVGSPPKIIRPPGNVGIEIEKNGTLECEAVGMPAPKIIWRRGDGKPLDTSGRFVQLPSGGLHVANIKLGDEGIYTCLAQNAFGVNDASAFVSVTGIIRPLIAYSYPIVKVQQGENAELECIVLLGKPTPKINWLKDGKIMAPSRKVRHKGPGKIVIRNITHEDDGEYVCHASNIGGNSTYSINVDVLVPPKLIQDDLEGKRNYSVNQGKGIVLPCRAVGDPRPTFQWYKDGSPISLSDTHYYVRNDGSLEIFTSRPDDTGSYKCVASNVAGGTEKVMSLFVRIAPEIEGELDAQFEIMENDSILLPCNPNGTPTPQTFWRRNFTPFRPRSSRVSVRERGLFIKQAKLRDKAIYECVASNIAGNTTKVITLIVYRPPTINAGPTEITVMNEDPVIMECETDGDPRPTVEWRKNNTIMDLTDSMDGVFMVGAGSLSIDSVKLNDAANYRCSAKNPAGEVHEDFRLIVHAPPMIVPNLPTYSEVIENNPVMLPCPSTGTPPPKITWLKDGIPIQRSTLGVIFLSDGSLELSNAQAEDTGRYQCIVQNVAGNASHAVSLKILVPPKLTNEGSSSGGPLKPQVIVNDTVTISCPVADDVDPRPIIYWYKDGQVIFLDPDDQRIIISDDGLDLIISRALVDDTARYKCLATNAAGNIEQLFDLDVLVPPKIDETTASPNNMTVVVGSALFINCPVDGIPPPQVKWVKDGQPISPDLDPNLNLLASGRRLEILNAKVTDRGRYTCYAKNNAGDVDKSYNVYVHVPPEVEKPGEVESAEVVKNGTLHLRCPISGIPPPKITWLKDDTSIKGNSSKYALLDNGWVLEIKMADVSDRGRHYCLAKNIAGENEKAFDVEVLVPPQINRTNTEEAPHVVVNNTAVISCPVTGNPQPEILWYRNNVLLDAGSTPRYDILAGGRQLRIYRTQVNDKGLYRCAARNRAGNDNIDFDLDVWVPPTINTQGTNFYPKVIVNSTIDIDCPSEGNPPPLTAWYLDGALLNFADNPDIKVLEGGSRLQIQNAMVGDSGRYTCVVTNDAGEVDETFQLSVHIPPEIPNTGIITDPKIIENETVTLECPAIGVPPPNILWMQEGQPIDFEANPHMQVQEGGRRLVIREVKVPDAAIYACVASNVAGEVTKQYDLEVWVPPHIDDTLREINPRVIKGHMAVMTCPVSGIPFPDITWLRDNQEIRSTDRVEILSGGLQLRVWNSTELDAGMYSCMVTSPAGEDRADFDLVVLVRPDIDESNVVYNPKVTAGRRVLLECPVSGVPIPTVKWLLNGQPLVPSEGIRILSNNHHVEILDAQVKDSAEYTCIATNEAGQLERTFVLEVLVPPKIDKSLVDDNQSIVQNQTLLIMCPVTGIPEPSIMWLKDRVPLLDFPYRDLRLLNYDTTLEVSNAQLDDAGNYTCRAMNQAGTDKVTIKLDVYVPPTIDGKQGPEVVKVIVNDPITMHCNISGVPEPSILWMKDNEMIVVGERSNLQIENNGRILRLQEARVEDTASYKCHAENQAGFADKQYNLQVQVPPYLKDSEDTVNIPVILEQSVTLECPVDGIPPPKIQWYRSGELIPEYGIPNIRIRDNGRRLLMISAQLMDFGSYTCQATNEAGDTSLRFLIAVMVPPEISYGPTHVAAEVGIQTVLQCEASGKPFPNITWVKDESQFPSTGLRHRTLRSGSLEFSRIMLEDAGTYTCRASNDAGNATRSILLDVQVPATISNIGPSVIKAPLSTSVLIPCSVEGTPKPTINWLKNRALLEKSQGYQVLANGSLYINDVALYHRGVYTCFAQNRAGSSKKDITLKVQVPPVITPGKKHFTVLQNRTVVMPCRTSGTPHPKIRWMKDGKEITSSNFRIGQRHVHYITLQNGGLAIPHARAVDAGSYMCVAENQAGNATETVSLVVEVPPRIETAERQYVVTVGDQARLPCKASGNPTPRIQWSQDGGWIDPNDPLYTINEKGTLIIGLVEAEDAGRYICTADNKAGRDSQIRLLRVQVPPRITIIPLDKEVTINRRLEIVCAATGVPVPVITWLLNGKPVPSPVSINGRSVYSVRNAIRADGGEYTCVATNPANNQQDTATANVVIKVPPRMLVPPGNQAVKIAEKVVLECSVGGDPIPEILWTKNGRAVELDRRIQQLSNGSLVIYDSTSSDAGDYKCIAVNTAGTSESVATVTVWSEPAFKIEPPKNQKIDQGETIIIDCTASGDPAPDMYWWKETTPLVSTPRVAILPNNSLRIIATQLDDSGLYRCFASNKLGKTFVETELKVVVHGSFSEWGEFGECSTTCGVGLYYRTRSCDNPAPANGGRQCIGEARESESCIMGECPVDANWGNWGHWTECSASCGAGGRSRSRHCDNPPPQFGGRPCLGDSTDQAPCNNRLCPIDGSWGEWEGWSPCSLTCGEGEQERERKCNNPRPQYGGLPCPGPALDKQPCRTQACAVDGNWGEWIDWTACSLSCGGGSRTRSRRCDDPRPQFGGTDCMGPQQQADYCNNEPCPVHGNWALWSIWGECSRSCNGGQKKRFRTCTNPMPSYGGRPCVGYGEELTECNQHPCPVDGNWEQWEQWGGCSMSCDYGTRERRRLCRQPVHGGRPCLGNGVQIAECIVVPCDTSPRTAQGNLVGNINNIDIVESTIVSEMNPTDSGTRVTATIRNVPKNMAPHLQHLISLLTPVYWTTAMEIDGAYNGYSLTKGVFNRKVQVEFVTGEVLKMTHYATGVDEKGTLKFDIVVSGEVPDLGVIRNVYIHPYTEQYIQTGPGEIYAYSSRLFRANGNRMPYAWNHTITYDPALGKMPFLVEQLYAEGMEVNVEPGEEDVRFQLYASIAPGSPSNRCPQGFFHDEEGSFCRDDDECTRLKPCSHFCHNAPGSYSCSCPVGFTLESDGRSCRDIDECDKRQANCQANQECINTIGSYQCVAKCSTGFRRAVSGMQCEDINECLEQGDACQQVCENTVGGFRCSCTKGFRLAPDGRCADIDECERPNSPCPQRCQNTNGGYKCSCNRGFKLVGGGRNVCRDVNECIEGKHRCPADQECVNTRGSYNCINLCDSGFRRLRSGQCRDINECTTRRHRCYYNQRCINTPGSYKCECPPGLASRGPGQPCADINECEQTPPVCIFRCRNLYRSFECFCPPGQVRLTDKKTCADMDECANGRHQCQHNCTNTLGSYRCYCPPGYRIGKDKFSCVDINECVERRINCGSEKMCFNTRGSHQCIDTPCPLDYARDPTTQFCVLECVNPNIACPPGAKYADVIEFRTLSLPSGNVAQDLIRLTAYNQNDEILIQTIFRILENDPKTNFKIRLENGKGVVYTVEPLEDNQVYRIKVRAQSYDNRRVHIQYKTTFIIHISVSAWPY